ncbi:MAG TPA: FAD-binding oxidoreductase [Jatrophihabitantaceae bacterium]|nr:FAD-binding oxidoreductase [Jatrophihabitantaceae bacterium]
MINRRAFLGGVGVGAAAALAACTTTRHGSVISSSPSPSPSPTTPSPSPSPTGVRTWSQLRATLRGGLLQPADPGYGTARLAYNPRFDGTQPAAVARCIRPADVQACVEFAAATRTPIAARSGGHSYAGYSTPARGLVVDVGPMSTVDVRRDGTAVVGAGARLMDIYAALAAAGRCLPGGSCPTVGIAGLTLGGGIGLLARKYGLTCDRLVSAQVITADGMLRTASATSEPDLYWALRGGGGGNLGVVTSFTFSTAPAPALTVFSLQFPADSAASVLGAWQDWMAGAPDELFANCIIHGGTPPGCQVGGCFVGSPSRLNPQLDDLVRRSGATPTSRFVSAKSYLDAMRYSAGCSQLTPAQCRPGWTGSGGTLRRESFVASSRIVAAPMRHPDQVVAAIAGSGLDAIFDSLGGAVRRVGATATAFPHRTALASVQLYHEGSAPGSLARVRDRLGALLGNHGYVNYIDPSLASWGNAYYGGNLPRLRTVAQHYDPDGVFAFAQGLARA